MSKQGLKVKKNTKVVELMKHELGAKIMTEFVGLRAKTYSYLKDNGSEDKKAKGTKKCVIKRKRKFENYRTCLEAAKFENKIKYLEKNKIDISSLKKDNEEFIKSNKLILKTQQRFKSGRHNVYVEEVNKVDLSSNNDK